MAAASSITTSSAWPSFTASAGCIYWGKTHLYHQLGHLVSQRWSLVRHHEGLSFLSLPTPFFRSSFPPFRGQANGPGIRHLGSNSSMPICATLDRLLTHGQPESSPAQWRRYLSGGSWREKPGKSVRVLARCQA